MFGRTGKERNLETRTRLLLNYHGKISWSNRLANVGNLAGWEILEARIPCRSLAAADRRIAQDPPKSSRPGAFGDGATEGGVGGDRDQLVGLANKANLR